MAESMQIVADIKIGNVDASALNAAFSKAMASGANSMVAAGGGGKGAGSADAAAMGSMMSDLIDGLVAAFPEIGLIAIAVTAIYRGFSGVISVFNAILTMLGMLVQPFANLLIPLMIPILYLLAPLVSYMNRALMPFFTFLMQKLGGSPSPGGGEPKGPLSNGDVGTTIAAGLVAGAATGAIIGALGGPIGIVVGAALGILAAVLALIIRAVLPFFSGLWTWVTQAAKALFDTFLVGFNGLIAIITTIWNKLDLAGWAKKIGDGIMGIWNSIDLSGKIRGIVDYVKGLWDKIGLSGIWKGITDTIGTFWNTIVQPGLKALGDLGNTFKSYYDTTLKIAMDGLSGVGKALKSLWDATLNAAMTGFGTAIKAFSDLWNNTLGAALKKFGDAVTAFINWVNSLTKIQMPSFSMPSFHSDFVMRPGQGAISFSPGDTLIGVKNPEALGGGKGGGMTYIINVTNSYGDKAIADIVKKGIEQANATTSRKGFYQQGW